MRIHSMVTVMMLGVLLGLLPWSAVEAASYVIELKNGRQFTTERYWIEGGMVKFQTAGGTLGFSEGAVEDIRQVKAPEYEEVTPVIPAAPPPQTSQQRQATATPTAPASQPIPSGAAASTPTSDSKSAENRAEDDQFAYYKQKRLELQAKIDAHISEFLAASGNKDAAGKQKARQQYLKYSEQLFQLQEELKEKNDGELPEWWSKI